MRRLLFRLLELYWWVFRPVVLGSRGIVVRGADVSAVPRGDGPGAGPGESARGVPQRGMDAGAGVGEGAVPASEWDGVEVLLVRLTYTHGWHLPGGGVSRGESFREAWVRELSEECGLEALDAELFGLYFSDRKRKSDHVAVYLTRDVRPIKGARPDPEIAEMKFFKLGELPADTTPATRRRIEEYRAGGVRSERW